MKKTFLVVALIVAGLTVKAQIIKKVKDIPSNVTSSLSQKYEGVDMNKVDWSQDGENYKSEFTMANKDYEVLFDNSGNWLSSEVEDLSITETPKEVQDGLNQRGYSSDKVKEVEMSETPEETIYKIEVREGRMKSRDLFLNKEGKIIKEDI